MEEVATSSVERFKRQLKYLLTSIEVVESGLGVLVSFVLLDHLNETIEGDMRAAIEELRCIHEAQKDARTDGASQVPVAAP